MDQDKASHEKRIKQELKAAGVTWYGMTKFAVRYLPRFIHEDEHVKAIVYGRYGDKTGSIKLNEGTLIATNLRIIFLDHKPGYTAIDEFSYDVVAGINLTVAVFSAITLHTRTGDYRIRFANSVCAEKFLHYVEERRLENNNPSRVISRDRQ